MLNENVIPLSVPVLYLVPTHQWI